MRLSRDSCSLVSVGTGGGLAPEGARQAAMASSPSGEAWAGQRSRGLLHPSSSSSSCFARAVVCSCLAGSSSSGSR